MENITVQSDAGFVEPIMVYTLNSLGDPLTGAVDLFVRMRRSSDGLYFDWADATFKAAGWATLDQVLTEVDAVRSPGLYEVAGGLDLAAITNPTADDNYTITPIQTGSTATLPAPAELRVDKWAGQLLDIWRIKGLDASESLNVNNTTRKVGATGNKIDQTITVAGDTITVQRV
jgi:hypothetical protein